MSSLFLLISREKGIRIKSFTRPSLGRRAFVRGEARLLGLMSGAAAFGTTDPESEPQRCRTSDLLAKWVKV